MVWLRRLQAWAVAVASIWLVLGFVLRISGVRDFTHFAQLPFYTTPWLVQAVGFAVLASWERSNDRGRMAWMHSLLAVMAFAGWATSSWRWAPADSEADLRLVLWNVSRPSKRLPQIAEYLHAQKADVIALAEWRPRKGGNVADWERAFPGYQVRDLPGGMLLLTKGKITPNGDGTLEPSSFYGLNRVQLGAREVLILQADLYASPFADRTPGMGKLNALLAQHAGQPLVLAGDLNTPRESRLFDPIRRAYRHAFVEAGRGYAETWPVPLPVLGLDQVWVTQTLEVVRCSHGTTPWSDHRPVIVDLRWRSAPNGAR